MSPVQEPDTNMKSPNLNKKVKVPLPKLQLHKTEKHFSVTQLSIFVLAFGIIGYFLIKTFATSPLIASLEAEQMSLPAGGSVITDTTASGGQAIKLTQNGNAAGSVSLPSAATSLSVSAKGTQCSGAPNMSVAIDGANLLTNTAVSSTAWANYSATTNLNSGTHNLSVSFTKAYTKTKGKNTCSRALYVDVTTFYGPSTITPPPTVSLSASPTSVSAGGSATLTWNSTTATSCSASGAWSGSEPTSGSASTGALNQSSTYSLTCTGAGGSASASATVSVNSTSVNWPASYTTGPLGVKNILPNTSNGVLLIDNYGYEGQTWAQYQTEVLQRETDMSRKFDGIHVHWSGNNTAASGINGLANCAYSIDTGANMPQWIHNEGSVPLISWSPNANLDQIASGSFDTCYKAIADNLRQYPFRIMLRMMWEQDGNWFLWSACSTTSSTATPPEFISDWQRIVNIFKQEGAGNVGFWWTPTEGYNRTCANQTYPGDAYVDWVGADDYNHDLNSAWSTPLHPGWAELNEIMNYDKLGLSTPSKQSTWGPHKPFVIGESGSKYDTAGVPSGYNTIDPNRKANWFRDIASSAAPNAQYLRGISFFDAWLTSEGSDWRVDSNQPSGTLTIGSIDPTTYQGFIDMSHASVFNAGVAGGAN